MENFSIKTFFNKEYDFTILFIFLIEVLSLIIFLLPNYANILFIILSLAYLVITLYRLEYGLWILIIELIIGSKGYLFSFDFAGTVISIRIALWLILLSVWLAHTIINCLKAKKFVDLPSLKQGMFKYFLVLFAFILWGLINGVLNHNLLNNIFFDFNGWLYFAIIFPLISVFNNKNKEKSSQALKNFWQVFAAAIVWLSLKTIFLLYAFSHNMYSLTSVIYKWVRVTGVGEITRMEGDFYRIFLQSHIYALVGFFLFFILSVKVFKEKKDQYKKELLAYLILASIFLSVVLISFSRSNWVGLASGALIAGMFIIYKFKWRALWQSALLGIVSLLVSVSLIAITVNIPWPDPIGNFSTSSLISKRASQVTGEAGASSRWALWPKLWTQINKAPILGQGFGATVTYQTLDPRILETSPTGEYTTYAFEWGWLDIWLKLGIFGLLAYVYLFLMINYKIFNLIKHSYNEQILVIAALNIGLIAIAVVNFFSPYLNHPLGIGYLLIISVLLDNISQENTINSKLKAT